MHCSSVPGCISMFSLNEGSVSLKGEKNEKRLISNIISGTKGLKMVM